MTVIVWLAADGWRWHAKAKNGRVIAESGEGYMRRSGCIKSARRVFKFTSERVLMLPFDRFGERTEGEWLR